MSGCCHNPMGRHWPNEPATCCHVHAESLPSNNEQRGEVDVPKDWTAQEQATIDALKSKIAEAEAEAGAREARPVVLRHRHTLKGP